MPRLALLVSIVAAVLGLARCQEPSASVTQINSLIRSEKYDQALALAKSALRTHPGDARFWTLEGIIYSLKKDREKGISAFGKALRLSPDFVPALKGQVQLFYLGHDQRAIPLLQRLLVSDSSDQIAHEMLAMLERDRGDCRAASEQFLASKESVMDHAQSLEGFGDCLVRLNQFQEAIPVFERLAELRPASTNPKYDLAFVLVAAKQYERALQVLEPLLTPGKEDAEIMSLASEAYEATGKTPAAVSALRQAIVLNPREVEYYVSFATICLDHDSFEVGIDMMNAGLSYNPSSAKLYISRGLLYAQLAEYDEAEADFKHADQLDSNQTISSYADDLAAMQRNDPDKALNRLRTQLKDHPDSPLLNFLLAKLLMMQTPEPGSAAFNEAKWSSELAVKLKPSLVDARDVLASIYMALGQYELAVEQSRLSLQYVPSDETAAYHLLVSLRHAGDKNEIPELVKHISDLHRESRQKESNRKMYRLVEGEAERP